MAIRRKYDIVIIAALVLAAIAYSASGTEYRLRPDMPTNFFDASDFPPARRTAEEKIARAYWECAVKQVQWKYGYASRLPEDPTPDFSVSANEIGPAAKDEAVRRRYWMRLRSTWNMSSAWNTQYQWSSISFRQSIRSAGDWWGQKTRYLLSR